ncbi:MAG: FAD:protein FMN transferase, partial [Verrucomicrobiota bacterium]
MATSGGARRGFHVAGHRYSHVLDPRTGWPVDRDAAATTAARAADDVWLVSTRHLPGICRLPSTARVAV